MDNQSKLQDILQQIKGCRLCEASLPAGPNPVIQASSSARILIAGQAPGLRVHNTGIPFNDPSGERLRAWMGVDKTLFYDRAKIAIVPMAFCYPGSGPRGDLPPPKICSQTWHLSVLSHLNNLRLILAIGQYAQAFYLPKQRYKTLRQRVKNFQHYLNTSRPQWRCKVLPLPHPSPRNNLWLKQNPWFEDDLVPLLKKEVARNLKL